MNCCDAFATRPHIPKKIMKPIKLILILASAFTASSCDQSKIKSDLDSIEPEVAPTKNDGTARNGDKTLSTFRAEVWADNWSVMYVGETLVMEDSVPITTERSFNAEVFTFQAERPFDLNVVMKDFTANESGLEYIGAKNQQMGDGGYIAQITDTATGDIVVVSNSDWKCLTINTAPLHKSCERSSDPMEECKWKIVDEPVGWKTAGFDDGSWTNATVHPPATVRPKDGYDEITWDASAKIIWGADLEIENTILCRVRVN